MGIWVAEQVAAVVAEQVVEWADAVVAEQVAVVVAEQVALE